MHPNRSRGFSMQADRLNAGAFITLIAFSGASVFAYGMLNWHAQDLVRLVVYIVIAAVASGLKVSLPGVNGSMSVNFLFVLLGIVELNLPEALLIGITGILTQMFWKSRAIKIEHLAFNVGGNAAAIGASYFAFTWL